MLLVSPPKLVGCHSWFVSVVAVSCTGLCVCVSAIAVVTIDLKNMLNSGVILPALFLLLSVASVMGSVWFHRGLFFLFM